MHCFKMNTNLDKIMCLMSLYVYYIFDYFLSFGLQGEILRISANKCCPECASGAGSCEYQGEIVGVSYSPYSESTFLVVMHNFQTCLGSCKSAF